MAEKVVAATVLIHDAIWQRDKRRPKTYWSAETTSYNPSQIPQGVEFVAKMEVREDGWLIVDRTGYADGDLEMYPPVSISSVTVRREKEE